MSRHPERSPLAPKGGGKKTSVKTSFTATGGRSPSLPSTATHLSALLEALVGLVDGGCNLLALQLAQFAVWVPQPGHHAGSKVLLEARRRVSAGRVLGFSWGG